MKNDFKSIVGHRFNLCAESRAVEGQEMAVEPNIRLPYTWIAYGLENVINWTLTPTSAGTQPRMDQSGFRHDQQPAHQSAKGNWQKFFTGLERVVGGLS